jgi:flagellar biosynthesis protein FlhF
MNVKKYYAHTTQEAIKLVKKEMGPDAVILRTKTIHIPARGSVSPREKIEVTAAIDYDIAEVTVQNGNPVQSHESLKRWDDLESELKEIKDLFWSLEAGATLKPEIYFNGALRNRYIHFKNFGLNPETIKKLMPETCSRKEVGGGTERGELRDSLLSVMQKVNVEGKRQFSGDGRLYSFIGPTGVGKTTTLAKLAALSAVKQGKRVALITIDTFRIAAVAQLETYARIMDLPLEVASRRDDLQMAISKHEDCDAIFIDTAGMSPSKHDRIREISEVLNIGKDIHHYLVLSATTQYQTLLNTEKRFGVLPFGSYIFTKLDETDDASPMLNFLISRSKPVSYFTTGQQVPEDMEQASRKRLASMILNRHIAGGGNMANEVN